MFEGLRLLFTRLHNHVSPLCGRRLEQLSLNYLHRVRHTRHLSRITYTRTRSRPNCKTYKGAIVTPHPQPEQFKLVDAPFVVALPAADDITLLDKGTRLVHVSLTGQRPDLNAFYLNDCHVLYTLFSFFPQSILEQI